MPFIPSINDYHRRCRRRRRRPIVERARVESFQEAPRTVLLVRGICRWRRRFHIHQRQARVRLVRLLYRCRRRPLWCYPKPRPQGLRFVNRVPVRPICLRLDFICPTTSTRYFLVMILWFRRRCTTLSTLMRWTKTERFHLILPSTASSCGMALSLAF